MTTRRGRAGARRARRRRRARQHKWLLEATLLVMIVVIAIGPVPGR